MIPYHTNTHKTEDTKHSISSQKNPPQMLTDIEDFFHRHLAHTGVFADHMAHPVSKRITTIALIGVIIVLTYKAVFQLGISFGLWEMPGKEYFVDTPVHCAHVYVEVQATVDGEEQLNKPLQYHVEFSPEEYNDEDPDLGCTLGFLRKKCYFLFKDSKVYAQLQPTRFTFGQVDMFDSNGKLLTQDAKPLCLQGVETGHKVKVICRL